MPETRVRRPTPTAIATVSALATSFATVAYVYTTTATTDAVAFVLGIMLICLVYVTLDAFGLVSGNWS
ncbi:hypothetical protein [Natrinema hispanicum]|nr:hypothetical protein [Natrinema hispanicum]